MAQRTTYFGLVLILFLSGCSRSGSEYLRRGEALLDARKYAEAVLELRKAIQKDPNLGEAYARLGVADEAQGDFNEAFRALSKAAALMPQNRDVQVKLGNLAFEAYVASPRHPKQLYDTARDMAARLVAADPNSADGLILQGNLALLDQNPPAAVALLQKAAKVRPASGPAQLGLAQALIASHRIPEAEAVAVQFLQRQKDYGGMYDLLYRQYMASNRKDEAEKILKDKVTNNPKSAEYVLQLAEFYAQDQRRALVTPTLQRLLDNPADFPQARLLVGDFYNRIGDRREALRQFEEGAKANPKDNSAYEVRIAGLLSAEGKNHDAVELLTGVLKQHPENREAATAHATLLLASGQPEAYQTAVTELKGLTQQHSQDADLRYDLGLAYAMIGDLASAKTQLREAVRLQSTMNTARFVLANIALSQNDAAESLRQADEILARTPGEPSAKLTRAESLMRLGRFGEARADLAGLTAQFPASPQVRIQLAQLAVLEKKYGEAERILQNLRTAGREPVQATLGLAETYARQRQYDKALQLLNDEAKKTQDPSVRKLLAETARRAGKYDVAAAEYTNLLAASPRSVDLLLGRGQVYEAKGDVEKAIADYRQAQQNAPANIIVTSYLAAALQGSGNSREALSLFRQMANSRPDDADALNDVAYMICETGGNLDEALAFAQRALQKAPQDPAIVDTLAWVYLKKGRTEEALRLFGSAVQKDPSNATFRYHLGLALYQKGDKQKARSVLQDALDRGPSPTGEKNIRDLLARIS